MAAANISIGEKFTRWTVTSFPFKKGMHKFVSCLCECGNERQVRVSKLRDGTSKSCGCWRDDGLRTHGHTSNSIRRDSHEYWIWNMVVQRCTNPNVKNWNDYGGRGITVCDSWLMFENFYADMGKRPSKNHSLERINNNSGYCKENCRWATRLEQGANKRNNRRLTAFGKTQHLAEWAREFGIHHATIKARIDNYGWSVEDAIATPVNGAYHKRAA